MNSPFSDLFSNRVLWAAVAGWLAAQLIKTLINLVQTRQFKPSYIVACAARCEQTGANPQSHDG
jgi:acid phosphatase family membrane protein YuiD